jgi:multiple sugar transport system substrate-binding protein
VALAAAGACCLTLASCSDPSSPGAGGQSDSSEVKLNVWIMGEGGPTFTQLTKEFTDQTGVGVEVESIPWANVNDKLTTAVASGQGPDVVQVGISLLQTFDDAGVLTDLSELIADYPDLAAGNFPDGVSPKELDPEGRTMSIPWVSDVRVLFYRTDLLAAVGYDHAPANWNEMQTAAAKLAERGADQYGYTIPLWDNALILQYVWQQGGDIVAPDGSLDFQTPEFDAALDHYLAFFESGAAPSATDFDQVQGFVTGNSPMTVSGPYLAPSITDAGPDIADDWTVALLPAGSSSRTSLFAGSNLAVWNGTEHLNEAIQLIDFMTKPEIQLAWYEEMSELPASQAALDQLTAQGDPAVAVYVEQLADARVVPQVPGWDLIANELTQTLTAIVTGAAERGTAMEQFYAKAAEIQANYS